VAPLTIEIGRRLTRGLANGARVRVGALCRPAAVFVLACVAAGALASAWAPMPWFTLLRLWCQALFGEAAALGAWLAVAALRHGRRGAAAGFGLLTAALVAVYWDAYHREPGQLHVRHHAVTLAGARRMGPPLRIAHVSDIQSADVSAYDERALRAVMQERPDLVVLTGDYVQERIAPGAAPTAELARRFNALVRRVGLSAPLGVFATDGDIGLGCAAVFGGTGVRCLVNECVAVPSRGTPRIALAGLSTGLTRGLDPEAVAAVVASCPPAGRVIVVGHRPDVVAALAGDPRVGLVLAGHTHGGQIVLPLLGPPMTLSRLPRRYAGGLHDYAGLPLHVTRGVGMERGTAPQVRFLCPPELCVLDVSE
jgi:predicted MPP superfamily phosphohydrolase